LKFRNYTPINEDIKSISKVNIATPKDIADTIESTVEKIAKQVKEEEEKKREEEVVSIISNAKRLNELFRGNKGKVKEQ
jgi:hypothetical protein